VKKPEFSKDFERVLSTASLFCAGKAQYVRIWQYYKNVFPSVETISTMSNTTCLTTDYNSWFNNHKTIATVGYRVD